MARTVPKGQERPIVLFKNQRAWETWLRKNAASAAGVWVRMAKKGADLKSTHHADTLEVAMCYGWIDGQAKSFDEDSWLQKFVPRGPRSIWSKINREKVLALIRSKRMRPAGSAEGAQQ